MRARRLSLRLLLPAVLILLVVLLGALQYRWLGQVSEAERAQLQRSLAQRAAEFGAEFDREIALIYELLTIDGDALDAQEWSTVSERYDTWRGRALIPDLIRAVYIARSAGAGHALARWSPESRAGMDVEWPAHFDAVQRALALSRPHTIPASAGAARSNVGFAKGMVFTMALSPVVESVPALILPIVTRPLRVTSEADVVMALRTASTDFVVVELDRDVLTGTFIPNMVERLFPAEDANHYRVAIVDRSGTRIYDRDMAEPEANQQVHVDASATFFTGNRYEFSARALTENQLLAWRVEMPRRTLERQATVAATARPTPLATLRQPAPALTGGVSVFVQEHTVSGAATQTTRVVLPGWRIMLQHGAGSLDEAVAQARRRNLTTSFGILGVLIVGVGLIVANARKSERLAAQQMEFVATVSHELRTPLAVIRSAAQNLSAGVVDDHAQAKRYGELIEAEGRRLTDMVEEVLEFAGLSGNRRALALRPVDAAWLAQDVLTSQAQMLAARDIATEFSASDEALHVMADEEALRRVLANLIGNAAKYAASGRWIGLRVSRDQTGGHDQVCIAVADRGPGISAEDLPHLFEPFYRGRTVVEQQVHGNGLGLSLVARIVEAHRGSVHVSSTPEGGTTFTVRLPAASATQSGDLA